MYTEGEDMNTLVAQCYPLFRAGGSYSTEESVPSFHLPLVQVLESRFSLLQGKPLPAPQGHTPRLPLHQLCPVQNSHLHQLQLGCEVLGKAKGHPVQNPCQGSSACNVPDFSSKQLLEWLLLSGVNLNLFPVICLEICSPVWSQMSENCLEVKQKLSTNPCARNQESRRWGENILLNYRANLIFLRYLLCTLPLHTCQTCASIWTVVAARWINNCWAKWSQEVCFTSALHRDKMLSFISLFSPKSLHFRIREVHRPEIKGFFFFICVFGVLSRVREMPRILFPWLQ